MHSFRFYLFILALTAVVILMSCATNIDSPPLELNLNGTFKSHTLKDLFVNDLLALEQELYAATDSGLYKTDLNKVSKDWISLGLQKKNVLDVVFLPDNKMLAAIKTKYFCCSMSTLFISNSGGKSWQVYMNNFGGVNGKYTKIPALSTPSKISDTVFALGIASTIARSVNGANSWQLVHGKWYNWGGAGRFIKNDPYHTRTIWAGGVNALSQPVLLRSNDDGVKWQALSDNLKRFGNTIVESVCYDIAVFPNDNVILAGMGGTISPARVIRKSTDGGQTWETVYQGINTYAFAHSARDPRVIYASGRNAVETLFFLASADFGESWKIEEIEDRPAGVWVNDMVSTIENGQEVLYFATNIGVYSYTFEK